MKQALQAFLAGDDRVVACTAWVLEQGGEALWSGHPSRRLVWAHIASVWACAPLVVWSVAPFPGGILLTSLFALLLGTVVPVLLVLNWHETEYVLTPEALVTKGGIFQAHPHQWDLQSFMDVDVYISLLHRVLGLASLRLHSPDESKLIVTALPLQTAVALQEHILLQISGHNERIEASPHDAGAC